MSFQTDSGMVVFSPHSRAPSSDQVAMAPFRGIGILPTLTTEGALETKAQVRDLLACVKSTTKKCQSKCMAKGSCYEQCSVCNAGLSYNICKGKPPLKGQDFGDDHYIPGPPIRRSTEPHQKKMSRKEKEEFRRRVFEKRRLKEEEAEKERQKEIEREIMNEDKVDSKRKKGRNVNAADFGDDDEEDDSVATSKNKNVERENEVSNVEPRNAGVEQDEDKPDEEAVKPKRRPKTRPLLAKSKNRDRNLDDKQRIREETRIENLNKYPNFPAAKVSEKRIQGGAKAAARDADSDDAEFDTASDDAVDDSAAPSDVAAIEVNKRKLGSKGRGGFKTKATSKRKTSIITNDSFNQTRDDWSRTGKKEKHLTPVGQKRPAADSRRNADDRSRNRIETGATNSSKGVNKRGAAGGRRRVEGASKGGNVSAGKIRDLPKSVNGVRLDGDPSETGYEVVKVNTVYLKRKKRAPGVATNKNGGKSRKDAAKKNGANDAARSKDAESAEDDAHEIAEDVTAEETAPDSEKTPDSVTMPSNEEQASASSSTPDEVSAEMTPDGI